MLLPDAHDRARPAANGTGSDVITNDTSSIPRAADLLADLDALAEHLRGYFVVQVVVDDAGHRRTNFYRSAKAAERAVDLR